VRHRELLEGRRAKTDARKAKATTNEEAATKEMPEADDRSDYVDGTISAVDDELKSLMVQ
jgi:hypothetical protein